MSDADAREVERALLRACVAPWDGPSPRAWRARLDRVVIRVDAAAARRRRVRAVADRAVRSWPNGDGTGGLLVTASDADIALANRVINDLALGWSETDDAGARLSMDQRRVDALMDVLRRIHDGEGLPRTGVRRTRELGLVIHADTFFGDGPAAADPGELRGLGAPSVVDAVTAAEQAHREIARGAATCVLLTNRQGDLERVVRVGRPVAGRRWTVPCWSRRCATHSPGCHL